MKNPILNNILLALEPMLLFSHFLKYHLFEKQRVRGNQEARKKKEGKREGEKKGRRKEGTKKWRERG